MATRLVQNEVGEVQILERKNAKSSHIEEKVDKLAD